MLSNPLDNNWAEDELSKLLKLMESVEFLLGQVKTELNEYWGKNI